jgi:hypothetical protein
VARRFYVRLVGSKDILNVGLNSVALLSSIISASAVLNAYTTRRKSDEDRLAEHTPSGSALLVITFVVYFDNIGPFNLNNLARRQIYFKHAFCDRGVYIFKIHRGRYAGDYTRDTPELIAFHPNPGTH